MDAGNLIANTALRTVGWLAAPGRPEEKRRARAAQESLVALVVASLGHAASDLRRPRDLQHALIEEINRQSAAVVRGALRALLDARRSGVKYRLVYEEAGGRTVDKSHSFDNLPFGGGFDTAFAIATRLRELPPPAPFRVPASP